jgi:hypothetical protein
MTNGAALLGAGVEPLVLGALLDETVLPLVGGLLGDVLLEVPAHALASSSTTDPVAAMKPPRRNRLPDLIASSFAGGGLSRAGHSTSAKDDQSRAAGFRWEHHNRLC